MKSPPKSVCLDLLEMIVKQQVTLFTTKTGAIATAAKVAVSSSESQSSESKKEAKSETISTIDFSQHITNRLCPLLSNMLTAKFVIGLGNTNNGGGGNNPASFALLLTLMKLAATMINVYGTHPTLQESLHSECHVLMVSLVKYIKAATEFMRDSHDFEVSREKE